MRRSEPLDERGMLDACGHDGPWLVVGHICARGPGGWYVQIVRCLYAGGEMPDMPVAAVLMCGREYLVETRHAP